MNVPMTRRGLITAGSAALGAAMVPVGISAALAKTASTELPAAVPLAFDPAAFIADLTAAECSVVAYYAVPRGGEPAGPSSYFIRPPKGRGFGDAYAVVMAKWGDTIEACPDHAEQVADHVFGQARRAE